MQAAVQSGGPFSRNPPGRTTSTQLKGAGGNVSNSSYSAGKGRERERNDQTVNPNKRERNVKLEDADASPLKRECTMKPEEVLSNLDKDEGLVNVAGVDCLVQLMQQDQNDGSRMVAAVTARRVKLANVLAATEKEECLNWFLQLGGLPLLDEWIQEAHKGKVRDSGSPKEEDKGVEELLLGLLRALDRLPVDLEALKTCVIGKSVNHLRSHKNLEIQKKARKLVDVWKKRVDLEMKLSGEAKASGENVMSWSYKQSPSEPVYSLSAKCSGGSPEVAVRSSGASSGNAHVVQIEPNSWDGRAKPTAGSGRAGSPTLPGAKDGICRQSAGDSGSDAPANLVREERSSSSSHSPNSGHSWGSWAGKSGITTWKDEAKNGATMPSKAVDEGSRLPNKVQSGRNSSTGSGKPVVWSRNLASDKGGIPVGGTEESNVESGGSQQRLIVRTSNTVRSPARASEGAGDGLVCRTSSPSALERQLSTTLADSIDGMTTSLVERVTCPSSENVDARAGDQGKSGDFTRNEKTEGEVGERCRDDTIDHKIGNPGNEPLGNEKDFCDTGIEIVSADLQKRSMNRLSKLEYEGMELKNLKSTSGVVEDRVARSSKSSSMGTDEGAMSLLATVAAAAEESAIGTATKVIRRIGVSGSTGLVEIDADAVQLLSEYGKSSSQILRNGNNDQEEQQNVICLDLHYLANSVDAKEEPTNNSMEQGTGDVRSGTRPILREATAAGNCQALSVTVTAARFSEGRSAMELQVGPVDGNVSLEYSFPKDYKLNGRNSLETKCSGFDGPLSSKLGKREVRFADEGLPQTHSKVSKCDIELCNGIKVGGADYNSSVVASLELRMIEEKDRRKTGQEVGQLFGRRGDFEAQRIADPVFGFPEEDVLEVARQAADEVEQMEKYGKSVSSLLLERDSHDSRPLGMSSGSEARASSVADASGADYRRIPVVEQPKVVVTDAQDHEQNTRNSRLHLVDSRSIVAVKLDGAANSPIEISLQEVEKPNKLKIAEKAYSCVSPSLQWQEQHQVLEPSEHDARSVDNNPPLSRGLSLQPTQAEGYNVPSPQSVVELSALQHAIGSSGPTDAVGGGIVVFERPVFDLNEGFAGENSQDDAATVPVSVTPILAHSIPSVASASAVAAPIAVLAATKGAFIPPASPLRINGVFGWKGSAATSAFRPAEPRRTPERLNPNEESIPSDASLALTAVRQKRARPLLEFDLNVTDERVMHETGVVASTLSSQGSVLGMSLHNNSVPLSSVSGVTFVKQETSCVTFLKPESSSSVHLLSNGGSGLMRSSQGQAPPGNEQGGMRPTLDLDLNLMDDSEENAMPFSVNLWGTVEGPGSTCTNNSRTQPPRPMMDIDLNDGPSFEEGAGDDLVMHPLMSRKSPAGTVGSPTMAQTDLWMGRETMSLSPLFSGAGNGSFCGALSPFPSGRPLGSGYSIPAAHSFLNASAGSGPSPVLAPIGSSFSVEMFRAGGPKSAPPAVVYPRSERMIFGEPCESYPVVGNSSGYLTSTPFSDMSNLLPPLVSLGTMTSSYVRPTYLMGIAEMVRTDNVEMWSRPTLDLNSGPEAGENESTSEGDMHGRLPPLHPGAQVFTDLRATLAQVTASSHSGLHPAVKRKEPEGGWNIYTGVGPYKQMTWM